MYRYLSILLLGFISVLWGESVTKQVSFEYQGISIQHKESNGTIRHILVKRNDAKVCKQIPMSNSTVWEGSYANSAISDRCKSTYIETIGKLLPMQVHEEVETYGVLEVLAFIKEMQKDKNLLLIDARKSSWFKYRTIPGAINIPFHHISDHENFEFEFEDAMKVLDIRKYERRPLDFRYSKTIVIFCNGAWCTQSNIMIDALIELGYDPEKIKWYRGGIQSWLISGMTSTRE